MKFGGRPRVDGFVSQKFAALADAPLQFVQGFAWWVPARQVDGRVGRVGFAIARICSGGL